MFSSKTKMNYLLKNSPRRKSPTLLVVGIGIAAVLILLLFIAPSFLSAVFLKIISPFWSAEQLASTTFTTKGELIKENTFLKQKLAELDSSDMRINQLLQENVELKQSLGRTAAKNSTLAVVLKKPPYSAYDTLIIDVGVGEGIKVGDTVFALGHIPVGKIEMVSSGYSKVSLFSNPGQKYDVNVGKNNIQATATARGGGAYEITIPRDVVIQVGDLVTIPSIYPSPFGVVSTVVAVPARAFATVLFNSPVNIHELKWVTVEHTVQ